MGLRKDRRQGGWGEGNRERGRKAVSKGANLKACLDANFSLILLLIILSSVFIMLTLNILSAAIFFSLKQGLAQHRPASKLNMYLKATSDFC